MVAQADDIGDVQKLLASGKNVEAMQKADQFLQAKPRDPMMRFLRGISLSQAGRTAEAITAFTKLTEDFPELPEPFNNLAVLYAQQGQYDKARTALEMAIRTNPSYATAYENLGDVYAKLASQAYSKALQIDTRSAVSSSPRTATRWRWPWPPRRQQRPRPHLCPHQPRHLRPSPFQHLLQHR